MDETKMEDALSSNPEIGRRLAKARANKSYTIDDAARLSGVTPKTIKKWEAGKSNPRSNKMQQLSGILGVPLVWLLEGGAQFETEDDSSRQLKILGNKIERISKLQKELTTLNNEVANGVEELNKSEEEMVLLQ